MTKIKICGITNKKDAQICINSDVDYIGLNFYKKSLRYIFKKNFSNFLLKINKENTKFVGVFVNKSIKKIIEIVDKFNLDLIQLHGDENNKFIEKLRHALASNNFDKVKIIKAIRIKDNSKKNLNFDCDYLLFDTYSEKKYGGTGQTFNYNFFLQKKIIKDYFLSGGLNPENIDEALKLDPYAVDINSGIEKSPGIKDHDKLKIIVNKIRKSSRHNEPLRRKI
ncbi:phosphoribosylanthranilate isomerase [Candidatus Woesearchaeota archaeon]|nr:phosphoribosylanthranilate isomerase [Candidatus Woesearchaeota archaeon]